MILRLGSMGEDPIFTRFEVEARSLLAGRILPVTEACRRVARQTRRNPLGARAPSIPC